MSLPEFANLNRRGFIGLAGAAAGVTALAACGGPSTSGGASASSSSESVDWKSVKPAKEIQFWSNHPGKSKDVETAIVNAFNSSQSETKVSLVTAGASYEEVAQKFQTAQTGGQLPGVILQSDVWWFRNMINELIIPLDDLMKAIEFDATDYQDSLVKDYQYGDKQWGVPYARSTPLFYYNAEMFKAAGVQAPKTWQELEEMSTKIKSANSGIQSVYQHPAPADYDSWTLQNKIWAWGGELSKDFDITCNSQAVIDAVTFSKNSVGRWAGVSAKDATADFSAKAVACTVGSTGSLVGILEAAQFEVGVAFLPGGPKATDQVCPTGGAGLGIPKNLKPEQQLAAANFLKFMGQPENAAKFAQATGYMPVRKSADMSSVFKERPQAQEAIKQLAHTRVQDTARVFLPGGDREIGMASSDVMTGKAEPQARFDQLKTTLEGIYTKEVKPKLG
ncbi:ABC transporter substrate-binding protein [Aestuariimicrobium sp. T2.26MG-19.2B]|uniref:ABC transporter substrate-binding protein n=1 Tax=Aestuariimicrobium sp. T2.26MG-19.2B TaxID=3040679 RepID=UPI002477729E|nr:ABC transporter substrate-binding protein [Aestuariimicrobium sp. T2.26MG-19.2B]CAI9405165.1 sn-glycerol-3-phosphate-binding periplasmic protein UgpB [Aestuariimicrobium sp. T2.26MG-19.2B]